MNRDDGQVVEENGQRLPPEDRDSARAWLVKLLSMGLGTFLLVWEAAIEPTVRVPIIVAALTLWGVPPVMVLDEWLRGKR